MRAFLALLALAASGVAAQPSGPPAWAPPAAGAFPASMAITGVVRVSGRELRSRDDRLAAFVDGAIRGVVASTLVGSRRVFFLSVAGAPGDGALTFQAYDALAGSVESLQPDVGFDARTPVGSVAAPVVWTPLAGGGPPAWAVDPAAFSSSMTLVGRVSRAGMAVAEPAVRVGAFLGGELRGAATVADTGPAAGLAFLTVYGDPADVGALTFRAYLPSADRTFAVQASVPFAVATAAGTAASPVALPLRPGAGVAGPEGWQMLAPPGADATVAGLLAPVWTQGYPGAGDAGGLPNVFRYTETAGQFAPAASAAEAWPRGEGRFVYVYADDDPRTPVVDGGFPKTLLAVGLGPSGGFRFGLTYTPGNGEPQGAGWNLLGNPFDETLDWDLGWTRTRVSNSVYLWDPAYLGGGYRVWNGVAGSLADGRLPRGYGFWAQATASAPVLVAPASAQVPAGTRPAGTRPAGRPEAVPTVGLRLDSAGRPGLGTEAWVTFEDGATDGPDAHDAWAFAPLVADYVVLGAAAGPDAPIRTVDARAAGPAGVVSVPLVAAAIAAGEAARDSLVLTWPGLDVPATWSVALVDTEAGRRIDLRTAGAYAFTVDPAAGALRAPAGAAAITGDGPEVLRTAGSVRFRLEIAPGAVAAAPPEPLARTALGPPAPNPARSHTVLTFTLADAGPARLGLYDVLGRRVLTLADGPRAAGVHSVAFDAGRLAAGLYVARLETAAPTQTTRVTVLR